MKAFTSKFHTNRRIKSRVSQADSTSLVEGIEKKSDVVINKDKPTCCDSQNEWMLQSYLIYNVYQILGFVCHFPNRRSSPTFCNYSESLNPKQLYGVEMQCHVNTITAERV